MSREAPRIETERLVAIMAGRNWYDVMRAHVPHTDKLYTWWSYRAKDWRAADRGRRLDHVWGSADLVPHLRRLEILKDARGWDRPSDHVPVTVTLDV